MLKQHGESTSLREAAGQYADFRWHVFPCHTVTDRGCSCGRPDCDSVAKHPRTANGLKDASRDPAQLDRWWPSDVSSNIAIATGRASGIVVVDVDPRHGGDETLRELEAEFGVLPRDWSVTTGGGGLHVYCRYPEGTAIKSRNGWRPGVDIKADGGYVIAPPSIHQSGNRYEWRLQYFDCLMSIDVM